jgi:hypothetical protein
MPVQVLKSEQINSTMQRVIDYDQPLNKREEILNIYKKFLGETVSVLKYQRRKTVFIYNNSGIKNYLITASVTYLSKPHPIFKKRMQLKKWYKDFYNDYKDEKNSKISLIGIYNYDNIQIFCDFNIQDYINNKLNSSSAHVYTNDFFQAMKNGVFEKRDIKKNKITVIKGIYLKD